MSILLALITVCCGFTLLHLFSPYSTSLLYSKFEDGKSAQNRLAKIMFVLTILFAIATILSLRF